MSTRNRHGYEFGSLRPSGSYLDLPHDDNFSVFEGSLLKSEGLNFFAVQTLGSSESVLQVGCGVEEVKESATNRADGISTLTNFFS
jgi:hypothetical protein